MRRPTAVAVPLLMLLALVPGCRSGETAPPPDAPAAAQAKRHPGDPLAMLPAEVNVVLRLDMAALVETDLYRAIRDVRGEDLIFPTPKYTEFLKATGFDIQTDLQRFTLGGVAKLDGSDGPIYVVVEGRFDRPKMEAHLAERPGVTRGTHDGLTTFEIAQDEATGPAPTLAWLDERTLIVATTPDFPGLVETVRGKRPNATTSALAARVAATSGQILAAMTVPRAEVRESDPEPPGMLGVLQQQLQAVETVGLTIQAASGVDVVLEAQADSAESAAALFETMNGYLSMGKMMAAQSPQIAEIVNKMKLVQIGSDVKLSVSVSQTEFIAAIEQSESTATTQSLGG